MGSTTKMTNNIIFYDGYCVVCSRFIRFLIKIDRKKIYSFANISSKISDKILKNKMDELLTMSRKTGFYEMIEIMIGKLKNVSN